MLLDQVLDRIKNYRIDQQYFSYYQALIQKYNVYFGQPYRDYCPTWERVPKPWVQVILSGFWALIFLIPFASSIKWPLLRENPLWLVVNFIPQDGQEDFATTVSIWSLMHLAMMVFGLTNHLNDYRFLALMNLTDETAYILKLNQKQWSKIQEFYRWTFVRTIKIPVYIIFFGAIGSVTFEVCVKQLWQENLISLIIWYIIFLMWLNSICYTTYIVPVFIWYVSYYLRVKQKSSLRRIERMNDVLNRMDHRLTRTQAINAYQHFVHWNMSYGKICAEIIDYNRPFKRYLTILVSGYVLLITYLTYLIFFTKITMDFMWLYSFLFLEIVANLLILILMTSDLSKSNKKAGRICYKILSRIAETRALDHGRLLKMETIAETLANSKIGFTFLNDFTINTETYFHVFYNISLFFFLVFK